MEGHFGTSRQIHEPLANSCGNRCTMIDGTMDSPSRAVLWELKCDCISESK